MSGKPVTSVIYSLWVNSQSQVLIYSKSVIKKPIYSLWQQSSSVTSRCAMAARVWANAAVACITCIKQYVHLTVCDGWYGFPICADWHHCRRLQTRLVYMSCHGSVSLGFELLHRHLACNKCCHRHMCNITAWNHSDNNTVHSDSTECSRSALTSAKHWQAITTAMHPNLLHQCQILGC